ncbi:UDP-N-acetylglucosamine--N-acetylmuramyl-(pentapeptide) pyrophosphoryl-undecaprenol N-acetylglucosamine transferase [Cryobacterium sp. TMT2-18-3]|uniref:UDP-N-acetylglucosamine--N-acetylmuramyl- (pentapeptide) pyrophosphoryl-undecaprenol N-acetylglucosamine transferase n=1 Tax=unclassified Cryobacterium TaxID=2649013 RepID=UPI00106960BF|nr:MULTISPECIES: UDP-N-acetylglucosamine--N-acetylmuramyl-(pentapeptide) pyrophosphoryl-undecaprenol N-acetylglucosamine transferase [unclassified Cryobacterium]TFC30906.1 UDP-N-acetylglucosamine--N-acetylmuramyl-(pentapeptide) pyrophosphoryl-undecaprenol N-acetylglucosamine transferase [Cryobacterium sp. TMT2-18-2]TFC34347.1 UDP-N-acetylglucosamine--N-acetylmuramyl-(pentapeptide) pyrophosphoryl-undecaprenol N-acetylglucosamine transferase [Cryobacterium sp. TMT2-42-4]TFC63309.1 UDP-N-acetylgluc
MTTYLLAGGGTAGHVNPLLAVADTIMSREPDATVIVLGTQEGLEARLVPARGYELVFVPRLPFPRRPNRQALTFLPRLNQAIGDVADLIRFRTVDVVVGFGGYVSTPAYFAARRAGVPIVIHEANFRAGLANRLGAWFTRHVAVAFPGTRIRHPHVVGMPLRPEIAELDRAQARPEALTFFGLDADRPTLLVTGGSLGARRLNNTIASSAPGLIMAGWQVLHITGEKSEVTDPGLHHYRLISYCDRMDLALSAADFAVSRAGAGTVCELSALGIPAVYVPYPVGNGEQRFNAADVVGAGGGILVDDADFLPNWVQHELVPVLTDRERVRRMGVAAASVGGLDGSARMTDFIHAALA